MPGLETDLHTRMLRGFLDKRSSLLRRIARSVKRELLATRIYGTQWGDLETVEPLIFVKKKFFDPYINPAHVAVEIGPGGGRWTQHMLPFKQLYAVEYYAELIDELKKTIREPNVTFVLNNGTDFPGIPDNSVDFLFCWGTFVHLDKPLIEAYLDNMQRILKSSANAVVQYSDMTKTMAQVNSGFSKNTPKEMRGMVESAGFEVVEEDLTSIWNSSVMRFVKRA